MSINRRLGISLLFSLAWHLFCLSFFSLSFLGPEYKINRQTAVSFFGSILSSPIQAAQLPGPASGRVSRLPPEAEIRLASITAAATSSLILDKQPLDPDQFIELDLAKQRPFAVKGFVAQAHAESPREIIFKPDLPHYPEWAQQQELVNPAVFKVYISAEGLVEQPVCVQASGNPEIDARLARYIKRWRFAPAADLSLESQIVKINLEQP